MAEMKEEELMASFYGDEGDDVGASIYRAQTTRSGKVSIGDLAVRYFTQYLYFVLLT